MRLLTESLLTVAVFLVRAALKVVYGPWDSTVTHLKFVVLIRLCIQSSMLHASCSVHSFVFLSSLGLQYSIACK